MAAALYIQPELYSRYVRASTLLCAPHSRYTPLPLLSVHHLERGLDPLELHRVAV